MSIEDIGYQDALDELQKLLEELERQNVDVDVLADKVERASLLIQVCRSRISNAEVRVKEIVDGLSNGSTSAEFDLLEANDEVTF